ncbi:MAG TPA: hypothetical protein VN541_04320, partial [Tepidisphaeraceae bacterium]|nr:hypothetical protein [Tepidisphaeraceae bacterium]
MSAVPIHLASFAAGATSGWDFSPAVSPWLLVPGIVLSVAAIAWLYLAQRRIGSTAVVATLTVIRIVLVLLVLAMLLAPARQWTLSRHSSGTLWLLVDQSGSMKQTAMVKGA